jgi:hypothetical protein
MARGLGAHKYQSHGIKGAGAKKKKAPADKPPTSVNINLGANKSTGKDKDLAAVEERAKQLMQTVAALLLLTGNQADSGDLARGADPWSKSVRELAQYEDWLRKLAAGGEMTGRAMAWINLTLVTLSIATPILVRHKVLPDNLAELATNMFNIASAIPSEGEPVAEAA